MATIKRFEDIDGRRPKGSLFSFGTKGWKCHSKRLEFKNNIYF